MSLTEETTEETTKTTEVGDSKEALVIAEENRGISYSWLMVCCHNVTPTVTLLLANPVANFWTMNILPFLNSPFVALTEVVLRPILANPILVSDWHDIFAEVLFSDVVFFMWNCAPVFNFASVHNWIPHNVVPSFSRLVSHPNAYNQSPTINVAVVKTP